MRWILLSLLVCGCYTPGRRVEVIVKAEAPLHSACCCVKWEDGCNGE